MTRTIFHVDMDAFFVSVEELYDPSLKGKPVVVGGQRDERGVVSAASYAARKFGVHSAMPLRTAAKLCPQAIFVNGHPERYREYSGRVHEVLGHFSPLVEMASVDEAYLDMTGTERLHGPPLRSAHRLHTEMKSETELNCSIGIGTSRLVAKVSSAKAKPNGVLWVSARAGGKISGAARCRRHSRRRQGDGEESSRHRHPSRRRSGRARRESIWSSASENGDSRWPASRAAKTPADGSTRRSANDTDPKSISHEHTFDEDTGDLERLQSTSMRFSEMVGRRLREGGYFARTIQLKLRYKDFTTITRAQLAGAADADGPRNL